MIRFLEGTDADGLGVPYPAFKDSETNNNAFEECLV